MQHVRRIATALLAALHCLAATPAPAEGPGPLEQLAGRVPAGAEGMVVLTDVAASLAETAPLSKEFDPLNRRMMAYTPLTLIDGFDLSGAFAVVVGGGIKRVMGFEIDEIGQIASWRDGPETPVIIAGLAERSGAVAAALEGRGFARDRRFGSTIWHRQEDFATDPARAGEDPFVQSYGRSARFAFDGEHLLFAQGWPGIGALLAGGPGLGDDADVAAILRAAYLAGEHGQPLEAILLGGQARAYDAVRAFHGSGPGAAAKAAEALAAMAGREALPQFTRHGLLLRQNGMRMSGAVAIPYPDRATAETALERIGPLLRCTTSLFAPGETFDELLPYDRHFGIVETGGRAVLVLAFEDVGGRFGGITPMMFGSNPYDRLRDMQFAGDLPMLLGGK
jgi:hypothetical protein